MVKLDKSYKQNYWWWLAASVLAGPVAFWDRFIGNFLRKLTTDQWDLSWQYLACISFHYRSQIRKSCKERRLSLLSGKFYYKLDSHGPFTLISGAAESSSFIFPPFAFTFTFSRLKFPLIVCAVQDLTSFMLDVPQADDLSSVSTKLSQNIPNKKKKKRRTRDKKTTNAFITLES